MAYVMNAGHSYGTPPDDYLGTILEGYEASGFDPGFLTQAVEKSIRMAEQEQSKQEQPDMRQGNLFDMRWK